MLDIPCVQDACSHPVAIAVIDINIDGHPDIVALTDDGKVYYAINAVQTLGHFEAKIELDASGLELHHAE